MDGRYEVRRSVGDESERAMLKEDREEKTRWPR